MFSFSVAIFVFLVLQGFSAERKRAHAGVAKRSVRRGREKKNARQTFAPSFFFLPSSSSHLAAAEPRRPGRAEGARDVEDPLNLSIWGFRCVRGVEKRSQISSFFCSSLSLLSLSLAPLSLPLSPSFPLLLTSKTRSSTAITSLPYPSRADDSLRAPLPPPVAIEPPGPRPHAAAGGAPAAAAAAPAAATAAAAEAPPPPAPLPVPAPVPLSTPPRDLRALASASSSWSTPVPAAWRSSEPSQRATRTAELEREREFFFFQWSRFSTFRLLLLCSIPFHSHRCIYRRHCRSPTPGKQKRIKNQKAAKRQPHRCLPTASLPSAAIPFRSANNSAAVAAAAARRSALSSSLRRVQKRS